MGHMRLEVERDGPRGKKVQERSERWVVSGQEETRALLERQNEALLP